MTRWTRAAGCNLFEMMIVQLILALILGGCGALVLRALRRTEEQRTRSALRRAELAVRLWQRQTGRSCPPGLPALVTAGLLSSLPTDAWGRPLRIATCSGRQVWLYSVGHDRRPHSKDDVLSWASEDRAWSPPPPPSPPARWPRALLAAGLVALLLRRAWRLLPSAAPI